MKKLLGKPIKFARWGGLSPVKQKGYDKKRLEVVENTKDFVEYLQNRHAPPARHGIYAFLWPFIDTFLLSSYDSTKNNHVISKKKARYNQKDLEWEMRFWLKTEEQIKEYKERDRGFKLQKPRIFEYYGPLWHHIPPTKNTRIIAKKGTWIKTSFEDYVNCLNENIKRLRKDLMKDSVEFTGNPELIFNPYARYGGCFSIDMLEVFIDSKI